MLSFLKKIASTSNSDTVKPVEAAGETNSQVADTGLEEKQINLPSWKDKSLWLEDSSSRGKEDQCRDIQEAITGLSSNMFCYRAVIRRSNHTDLLKAIKDPEKPNTLEDLEVITDDSVKVQKLSDGEEGYLVRIDFNPTVPHCSLASLIGLCLRGKIRRDMVERIKLDIVIAEGKHSTEEESMLGLF